MHRSRKSRALITVAALAVAGSAVMQVGPPEPAEARPAVPPEVRQHAADWPVAQGDLAGTRANMDAAIDAGNVHRLEVAWTFDVDAGSSTYAGGMTAPPLIAGDTVYLQDMDGNVFALERASGEVRWQRTYGVPTEGPNGLALGYGRVYGTLGDTREVFALDAETGEQAWRVTLSNVAAEGIDMAPAVHDGRVYVSTVPGNTQQFYQGGARGVLHALDAATGVTLWTFDTTTDGLWGAARINSGGGLWYPPSFDDEGNLYFGVGNPGPWPGLDAEVGTFPNGSSRPGPNPYTNSLVSLDPRTGSLRWFHAAKPHDLFDHDFQNTPVLTSIGINGSRIDLAIGSGKTGTVVAAEAGSGEVVWRTRVGRHENDELQAVPEGETVRVLPGILGGVETPVAYADGLLFVPVVNLHSDFTPLEVVRVQSLSEGTGELVALDVRDGGVHWKVDLPHLNVGAATVANDVVFTATVDGVIRAHRTTTGAELWTHRTRAGINAPMSVAGDLLVVPSAGIWFDAPEGEVREDRVIAFRLP